jgi:hypothetical protein
MTPRVSTRRVARAALRLLVPLFLSLSGVSDAAAQVPTPAQGVTADTALKQKSRGTAVVLSAFIPGAGHLYAGDKAKGWLLVGLWAGTIAVGAAGENAVSHPAAAGLVVIPWFYGMIDSPKSVARYNARRARVSFGPQVDRRGGVGFGAAFRF